jgi:tetratricopeptide (TPR) repeat protein/TolB-like protein
MPQPQPTGGLVGRTLGSYRVIGSLGSGGMGEVYLAEDVRLARRVALKVLPAETARDPERLLRFEREARTVAQLTHPGIVTLHSIEEADGLRFLTMEHVEGETLGRAIPAHGFPMERLLGLAIALTDAVAAAHRQGVLHRDLKPDNVMLTLDGRLKVLDFGLAKLRLGDPPGLEDDTLRETASVTQDGRILGTVAYMSPEQAQGLPVDHRSDIFSLGIVLYEMATGERPFKGGTNLSVLSSILKDTPRAVSELRPELPRPLARMVQRCLEKRPEDRYQSLSDLRRDLEDLKRDVDSGELLSTTAGRRRLLSTASGSAWLGERRPRWVLPAALAILLAVVTAVAFVVFGRRGALPAEDGRRSVAVFYFDNLSGEPKLDWLRTGLTEMLVANLSQSAGLRVLGTARLYQLLNETGHRDERTVSSQVVEAVARRAQVTTALVGSFVRAGTQIRIQATLQDAGSGEVIASERVEGDAENGLFGLVDELTTRLRGHLETRAARLMDHGKKLEDVTTSSLEALKAYCEGNRMHLAEHEREAQLQFEKAVAIDPGFAMALAKLSIVHANQFNMDRARDYSARAMERAGSLPPAERYYIEGRHYSLDPSTAGKAVEAYEKAVDAAPDDTASRNNLALELMKLHRYPEALVHLEELRRRGMQFPGTYLNLAEAYSATGQVDKAREALVGFTQQHPDRPGGFQNLGLFELVQGRLQSALAAFDQAAALHPEQMVEVERGRFLVYALKDRWTDAEQAAARLLQRPDARERSAGHMGLAIAALYRGAAAEARRHFEDGAETAATAGDRADARLMLAHLDYELGRYAQAIATAEQAMADARDDKKLRAGASALRAVCLAYLGRRQESETSARLTRAWLESIPKAQSEVPGLHFDGELALASADHARAQRLLQKAAAAPRPQLSIEVGPEPIEIRYALARAALASGDTAAARDALSKLVAAGPSRVVAPVPYVRGLALLASLEDRAGRAAEARQLYDRYLSYWKDGQIDRAEVARAGLRLAALKTLPGA